MSEHVMHTIERHCDVAVIGGSAAGLAAALQLARQRRSVIVVDAGEPRNAAATHMHGYLGHEGVAPTDLVAIGRDEVRGYGGEVLDGRVTRVSRADRGGFLIELVGGHTIVARRVLAATGLVDLLPDIEGVAEHWGSDVIHCPFCHGYEVRDQRIVQVVTHHMGLHPATLFRQLTTELTIVIHDDAGVDDDELARLQAAGVTIVHDHVDRVLTGAEGRVAGVELAESGTIDADVVVIGPRFAARVDPFEALGLRSVAHASGIGHHVETSSMGETSVDGLYAAGNVTDPSQQVLHAAADGSRVGAMISFSLADEDTESAARPSSNEADWEHRYDGDQMWSGRPNGALVAEITGLVPGRALDVGAGEGGDAIWLAEQGWQVTASDISQRALDRIAGAADSRGLGVECRRTDANALDAFPHRSFDLVTAHYASIPRTPDDRGARSIIDAVAAGGTLLVVSHDLAPMPDRINHIPNDVRRLTAAQPRLRCNNEAVGEDIGSQEFNIIGQHIFAAANGR
jgi:thioredoxin reductase/SAM-dependent methyltransferase